MAGISVPQYEIFKIGTNKLKYYNWDLKITKKEAFACFYFFCIRKVCLNGLCIPSCKTEAYCFSARRLSLQISGN